jgi:hypothetical protein
MRFINLDKAAPTEAWLQKANVVTNELDGAATKAERDWIVSHNSAVWRELKPWLLQRSEGKCWFSEARDYFSHWDVEHYRPKSAAKNADGTVRADGYWWLAFDWHNFRICGNVGNRKKGAFFPLRPGTHQATSTDRNIEDEFPLLLDPTRLEDTLLLSFDENGDVKHLAGLDEWNKTRVEESIKRYNLRKHEPLMEARRDVWSKCVREVNLCQNLMNEVSKSPSATKKEAVKQQMLKILEMAAFGAEFSATTNECLRSRSEQWAQRIASEAPAG